MKYFYLVATIYKYFLQWYQRGSVQLGPHFEGRGEIVGSPIIPLERAMVVSYRLPVVTIALSLTIRPQFAIECLQRSIQQEVGHFGIDLRCWGLQRANTPG